MDWKCPQCGYEIGSRALCLTCRQHTELDAANARIAELEAQLARLRDFVPEDEFANEWCSGCDRYVRSRYRYTEGIVCRACNELCVGDPYYTLRAILYPKEQGDD